MFLSILSCFQQKGNSTTRTVLYLERTEPSCEAENLASEGNSSSRKLHCWSTSSGEWIWHQPKPHTACGSSHQIPLVYILVRNCPHRRPPCTPASAMHKESEGNRMKSLVDLCRDMMDGFDRLLWGLRQKEASQAWCGHSTELSVFRKKWMCWGKKIKGGISEQPEGSILIDCKKVNWFVWVAWKYDGFFFFWIFFFTTTIPEG